MRLGMERIRELLRRLGNPQQGLRVIHVAGTNGKGSVCRYIYEVLEENGYRTGLFSSPYLETFRERIECDRALISEARLAEITDRVMAAVAAMTADGLESPTEFEAVTAAALLYFHEEEVDFAILEVGLGGRGDSTNVIERPLVSVITSISYDHMDRLGDTLAEIAGEKAGIIKPGVPVVCAAREPEAEQVIARAAYAAGSRLYNASACPVTVRREDRRGSLFDAEIDGTAYPGVEISMCGGHQVENAVCALTAIEILRKSGIIKILRPALDRGMQRARQKGRFEIFPGTPDIVLDGAHNQGGMEALVQTLDDCYYGGRTLTVLGLLADKAVDDILDMAVHLGDDFIATEPDNPRRLSGDELAARLRSRGRNCRSVPDREEALRLALEEGGSYDVILCAGSLYLIGALRRRIRSERTES